MLWKHAHHSPRKGMERSKGKWNVNGTPMREVLYRPSRFKAFKSPPSSLVRSVLRLSGSFKEMTTGDRREFVQRAKLCYNCLKASHMAKDCTSTNTCKSCKQKHHTLLCSSGASPSLESDQHIDTPTTVKQETLVTGSKEEEEVTSYVTKIGTSCSTN